MFLDTARVKRISGRRGLERLVVAVLIMILVLASSAIPASTSIRVSATIKPWLRFSAIPRVASYQVDAAAISRGYVDLPASLAVEVATNVRDEVLFALAGSGEETILVLNDNSPAPGILSFGALTGNTPVARSYDLRILLPPGRGEGIYPLQVQVSAATL